MESGQVSQSDRILSALLTEMDGMGGKIQEEFSSGTSSLSLPPQVLPVFHSHLRYHLSFTPT